MQYQKQWQADYNLSQTVWTQIVRTTKRLLPEFIDSMTDEVNATVLAEAVAAEYDEWEWLDSETHPLWDLCADLAIKYEEKQQ